MTAGRDRVLKAAGAMFAERGYSGTSMRDLAGELTIKAPSLYSHFPSKRALLQAVLDPLVSDLDQLLRGVPAPSRNTRFRTEWLASLASVLALHSARTKILLLDPTFRCEPVIDGLLHALERLGAPSRLVAIAILGAISYPLISDSARPLNVDEIAARMTVLLAG